MDSGIVGRVRGAMGNLGTKGQSVVDQVIGFVVVAMVLVLCVLILGVFEDSVDTSGYSSDTQDAINGTFQMAWTSFGLAKIVLIVLASVLVIGAVLMLARR